MPLGLNTMKVNDHFSSRLQVCIPPYVEIQRLSQAKPLPLGAILLVNLAEGGIALADAIVASRAAPWSPICLMLSDCPMDNVLIDAARLLEFAPAYLKGPGQSGSVDGADLVLAVSARPRPTVSDLVSYVQRRTGWDGAAMETYPNV
jgi:hypothetical protein